MSNLWNNSKFHEFDIKLNNNIKYKKIKISKLKVEGSGEAVNYEQLLLGGAKHLKSMPFMESQSFFILNF